MNRYEKCFARLQEQNEGAFVPFTVIGDPSLEASSLIIQTLADAGADALELGFPFSDPLADGPIIQGAMDRALKSGTTPQQSLDLIRDFRMQNNEIPIGLLVYANIVYAFGLNEFYKACKEAGVDSVLVADVPVSESAPFCQAANDADVAPILLCPPNIDDDAMKQVSRLGRGYTYLLSRAGVTGTTVAAGMPVHELLEKLIDNNAPPPLLGFGISLPEHVSGAIQAGASGVIVGSAIVKIIKKNIDDIAELNRELTGFVREMKAAAVA